MAEFKIQANAAMAKMDPNGRWGWEIVTPDDTVMAEVYGPKTMAEAVKEALEQWAKISGEITARTVGSGS